MKNPPSSPKFFSTNFTVEFGVKEQNYVVRMAVLAHQILSYDTFQFFVIDENFGAVMFFEKCLNSNRKTLKNSI
jgi:hypothetical protein